MKEILTPQKVLELAMRQLSQRSVTKVDLKNALERELNHQANADALIEQTLKRLEELSLFSDADVADLIVRRHAGKGDLFIRYKLEQSGINPITIAKTLAELGDEVSRAQEVALKKWPTYRRESSERRAHEKLFRFLSSRGFSRGTCMQVVNTIEDTVSDAKTKTIHRLDE